MGYGEDYIYRFGDWLDTLSPEERTEYRALFPEPVTWKGWWEDEDSGEVLVHGDFLVEAWQPEGQPKYTRQWLQQEFAAGRKRELCLFWGHQPSQDGQLTKKLPQPVVDGGLLYDGCPLPLHGAIHDGCQGRAVRRQRDPGPDFEMQRPKSRSRPWAARCGALSRRYGTSSSTPLCYLATGTNSARTANCGSFSFPPGTACWWRPAPTMPSGASASRPAPPEAQDPMKWRGQNLLGFALMEVRDELRRVTQNEMLCDWSMVWQQ